VSNDGLEREQTADEDIRAKLNRETGKISWHEMEKHFASGNVVFVSPELDLIEVAYQVSQDNKAAVEAWVTAQQLGAATDAQAAQWCASNAELWAVVVAPLVLVQPIKQ
jgi:hypothetical protein